MFDSGAFLETGCDCPALERNRKRVAAGIVDHQWATNCRSTPVAYSKLEQGRNIARNRETASGSRT